MVTAGNSVKMGVDFVNVIRFYFLKKSPMYDKFVFKIHDGIDI